MNKRKPYIIAIGLSTGGPSHVLALLKAITSLKNIAIIIIQHLDASYFHGFCHWLEKESGKSITMIKNHDQCEAGGVYVMGVDGNLSFDQSQRFQLLPIKQGELYLPNIDQAFINLAQSQFEGAAFLMTGMGEDGARGLEKLYGKKWMTAVQNFESCAVAGMPAAAMKLCRFHRVLTPDSIIHWILRKEQELGAHYAK